MIILKKNRFPAAGQSGRRKAACETHRQQRRKRYAPTPRRVVLAGRKRPPQKTDCRADVSGRRRKGQPVPRLTAAE